MRFRMRYLSIRFLLSVGCLVLPGLVQMSARTDTIPRSATPNMFTVLRSGPWEEHHVVRYLPPCRVVGLKILYPAQSAGTDTIHLTSTSRLVPKVPVSEHWTRAQITAPIVVTISGESQTVDIDLRSRNIRLEGYEALVVSHKTLNSDMYWASRAGPYLHSAIDTATFSMAVDRGFSPPRFLQVTQRFCMQVIVEHDYEIPATRVRPQSGSMLSEYNSVAAWEYGSNNASVVDLDGDGFDDVLFDSLLTLNRAAGSLNLQTVFVDSKDYGFNADISAWADMDRDGDADCIIHDHVTLALRLLRTDSTSRFTDITATSGITSVGATSVLLWFDADNDGDPDFFAGRDGQDVLWLNNGNGTFTDATVASGLAAAEPAPYDVCGSASLGDINADGFTDLIVVTRGSAPDRLYVNDGTGKFTVVNTPGRIGSASVGSHGNGEGAEWGDFNDDGIDDILVANSLRVDNEDALQDGSIVWRTQSRTALLFDTLWTDLGLPFYGSTNGFTTADLDLDGLIDVVGVVPDTQLSIADRAYATVLTRQFDSGRRVFNRNSFAFGLPVIDVGFALRTDIDMDGDPDFIVNRTAVLRNNLSNTNNGISIRLRNDGRTTITQECFGSSVTVFSGTMKKTVYFPGTICTGRGSSNSAAMTFGLGANTIADSIVVKYSDKSTRTFKNLTANGAYYLGTSGSIQRIAGPPRQQQPEFNAVDVSVNPRFRWSDMGVGITYDLQIARNNNFLTPARDIRGVTSTVHDLVSPLPTAIEYEWRIRARFADGKVSHWSTPWPLTVGRIIPAGLSLQSPPNGSVIYLPDVVFRWLHKNDTRQINALTQYRIEVALDSNFTTLFSTSVVDELQVPLAQLSHSTTYYWRVQAIQEGVSGSWSPTWSFSTKPFPGPIELIAPFNGELDVLAKTQLRWRKPQGLDPNFLGTYLMHFTLDSLCQDILDTGTSADTSEPGQYLLLNQKYYWRVRLVTTFGYGPWSDIWWFKTGWLISDVDDDVVAGPRTLSVRTFPMPFTDRISIGLPHCSTAHIRVHDIHGTLLEERHILDASASDWIVMQTHAWPSGPVIITVEADGSHYRALSVHLH